LVDAGKRACALHETIGIRADRDQEHRRVCVDGSAREPKKLFALGAGVGRKQLLALVEAQEGQRIGRRRDQRAPCRGTAQLQQQRHEGFGGRQALAQVGATCPQREAAVHVLERVEEPLAALDRAAATGTDRP
jgi:hypothetical protein